MVGTMSLLRHARAGVRRHAHLADGTIALAVFAATAATTFTGTRLATGGSLPVAIACAAIACAALAIRRLRPLAALAVSAVAAEAFLLEAGSGSAAQPGTATGVLILLAPCIAVYTVADLVERRRGVVIGGVALAALALLHAFMRPGMIGPENLAFTALGGLAIAAGDSSRNRRAYLAEAEQRAERAERDREADARRRVAEERLRIARDLHDSVGHHLAVISVQSDVASRAIGSDPTAGREALGHVKAASRKALDELRDTVSLLRRPGDPVTPTAIPAPGLDALDDLLGSLRRTGLAVDCLVKGAAVTLAPAADRTAYRVVQEALTNVYKHSASRQARVTLAYDRRELRVTVDDIGPGTSGATGAGGRPPGATGGPQPPPAAEGPAAGVLADRHGIVGMRERVLAIGGHFTAGPRPGGAFQVTATLPRQPRDIATEPAQAVPGLVPEATA
jgi:signal transduction histidine kinase